MDEITYWRILARRLLLAYENELFNKYAASEPESDADTHAFEQIQSVTGVSVSEFDAVFNGDFEEAYQSFLEQEEDYA